MTLVYSCVTGHLFCKTCPNLLWFSMPKLVSNSYQAFSHVYILVSCLLHQMLPCLKNLVQISILRQRSQLPSPPSAEKDWDTHLDTDYLNHAKAVNGNCRIVVNAVKRPDRPTGKTTWYMNSQIFFKCLEHFMLT